MKTIALLKKKLSKKSSGVFNSIASVGLGIVIGGALSDHELKKNVTTLPTRHTGQLDLGEFAGNGMKLPNKNLDRAVGTAE